MNPQDDDTNTRAGLWVVFTAVTVLLVSVIIWVLKGAGIDERQQPASAPLTASQSHPGHADARPGDGSALHHDTQTPADHAAADATTHGAADTVAPATATTTAASDESQFVAFEDLEQGELAAIIHFASASASLPSDAGSEISGVIDALNASASRRVLLAGFHDATGNPDFNADLARKRAFSVRDALIAQGVPAERIILRKPEQTTGSGTNAEARRVELRLLD